MSTIGKYQIKYGNNGHWKTETYTDLVNVWNTCRYLRENGYVFCISSVCIASGYEFAMTMEDVRNRINHELELTLEKFRQRNKNNS
jgi:uncharacterized membrane protein YiaA